MNEKLTPKQAAKALAPQARSQVFWEITGQRTFYVVLGNRTLAKGIAAQEVWKKALKILTEERACLT